ncbi:pyridoxamine 5'-phosphate oxidase family protein [uncultured Desulfobulbus sp.]|uniref:pyridoxamine 5'-phosphate oxidase family protein n=1 Tax=uncultured Desulfobulbus sp. TaxID=239745 RepID=UPI0029C99AC2|nr:pyridoxamine 5'-phosphate oxidase family protein [uncultured Desulfobulbus sp.]
MDLPKYFTTTQGTGILATASASGEITTAVYAKPHFQDDSSVAMIMRERMTYAHLQTNGHACYLFLEQGPRVKGIRLFLQKIDESDDAELLRSLTRRHFNPEEDRAKRPKHLVRFQVVKVLPVIGDGPLPA